MKEKKKKYIFVFGSNLAGRHGKGAAKVALERHGAIYGKGKGIQGNSYGIPTKDKKLRVLPLTRIQYYVDQFLYFAYKHPHYEFYVTRLGCGLAGYKDKDMRPLFKTPTKNVQLTYKED